MRAEVFYNQGGETYVCMCVCVSFALTALHDTLKAGDEPCTILVTVTSWTLEGSNWPFATDNIMYE